MPNSAPKKSGTDGDGLWLMIVDDNHEMRRVIRRTVAGLVQGIVECENGTQALDAYARIRPDFVLMDIEMHGADGIAATRRLIAAFPGTQVIIVTGHNDEQLREAARDAGACAYVLKENLLDLRQLLKPEAKRLLD